MILTIDHSHPVQSVEFYVILFLSNEGVNNWLGNILKISGSDHKS